MCLRTQTHPSRIFVIPNAVDTDHFKPSSAQHQYQHQHQHSSLPLLKSHNNNHDGDMTDIDDYGRSIHTQRAEVGFGYDDDDVEEVTSSSSSSISSHFQHELDDIHTMSIPMNMNPNHNSNAINIDAININDVDNIKEDDNTINIVLIQRLTHRKGCDLICEIIPRICTLFPSVHFIVGGDGPKRIQMEEMREQHNLNTRVEMVGSIETNEVRNTLIRF